MLILCETTPPLDTQGGTLYNNDTGIDHGTSDDARCSSDS
jgi:hypothetical protein